MSSTPPLLPAEIFRYFLKVGYVQHPVGNENSFVLFGKGIVVARQERSRSLNAFHEFL